MLSILICHSYFLRLDQKQLERGKPYPPLATLQVAGMLRKAGHKVSLFDAMLASGIDEYDRILRSSARQLRYRAGERLYCRGPSVWVSTPGTAAQPAADATARSRAAIEAARVREAVGWYDDAPHHRHDMN